MSTALRRRQHRVLPVLDWLAGYQRDWLRFDVIAGLTTAAVVIPKAMAYATIAGLPVEVGLYTTFLPMLIYAVFGTSRPLSVSTSTTLALLVGAEISVVAPNGDVATLVTASATLALLVGAILVAASITRLGFVANFISEPVLVGFKAGIGLVIVVDQLPKLLGIHIHKGRFFVTLLSIAASLPATSWATLAVGIAVIVTLVGLERLLPRVPAPLVAVSAAIAATAVLGLRSHGVEVVGEIPRGLPSFVRPDLSLLEALGPGALGIALMSFTETIAAGRAFAKSGEPLPDANQELFATGLANAGGALLGAMAAGGGTSQTAVNRLAGARTQLAAIVTALAALLTMLLLAPLIALMPHATLAAVVIVYSVGLIKPVEFRSILAIRRMEFVWALTAFAGVVLLGTLQGIVVAIVVSLLALAHQAANPAVRVLGRKPGTHVFRPRSEDHPEDETFPGLLLLRVEGQVFFANIRSVGARMRPLIDEARPQVVALDLSGVPHLEYTALKTMTEAEERERARGVELWLVGLNPEVLRMVQRSPLGPVLGRERMHFDLEHAVARFQARRTGEPPATIDPPRRTEP
jgi:SulP family sulfate permease